MTTALTSWCCWENKANAQSPRLVCAYNVRAPSLAVPLQPPVYTAGLQLHQTLCPPDSKAQDLSH